MSSDITISHQPAELHTGVIQGAIDACSASGGGRVVLEPGVYTCGTVELKTGVELHLRAGARLLGSLDPAHYRRREGAPGARVRGGEGMTALLFAEGAERVALTGEGTLDGQGRGFFGKKTEVPDWVESRKPLGTWIPGFEADILITPRPRALLLFAGCREVRIELRHIEDSPAWTVHLLACEKVVMRGVRLRGSVGGANTDGIDLDACTDVLVEDCDIHTGDDALALKNTDLWGYRRPSRGITVRRCRLASTTHGFTVGTETQRDIEDVLVEDCRVEGAGGHRCITGIGLSIIDGAALRRVWMRRITMDHVVAPVQIRLANAGRGQEGAPRPGAMENLHLQEIRVTDAIGVNLVMGLPGHPLKNVTLRDCTVELAEPAPAERIMKDVPTLDTEFPPAEVWRFLPVSGWFFRDVDGLEIEKLHTTLPEGETRPATIFHRVTGAKVDTH
jgi:polygalacturonase